MRSHIAAAVFGARSSGLLCCLALSAAIAAEAQTVQSQPGVVYVQPPRRSTVAGDFISAQADYVAAYGQFLQEAATARKINAEAVAQEIENWKNAIKARDEMVDLYWERWRRDHPNYLTRQGQLKEIMQQLVERQDPGLMRGDLSVPLNWMLFQLSGPIMATRYLPDNQTTTSSRLDQKLVKGDLDMLRLSDGGSKASRLVFSPTGDDNPLKPHWPLMLRDRRFDALRESYEQAVEQIVTQIKEKRPVDGATQEKVMQDINAILLALEDAFPKEQRVDSAKYANYLSAKLFLRAALASTRRAISTPDAFLRSGNARFQGDSLVGLMQHMYQSGLEFASPEPGGEGVYRKLFQGMRGLYLEYRTNQPSGDSAKKPSAKEAAAARGAADREPQ
jgi:hypothetical protein